MQAIPTAPGRLPLAGHLPSLARSPLKFVSSLAKAAKGGLVRIYLGTTPMYVVTAYEPADDLLVTQAHTLGVGRMFKQLEPLIGDSLATLAGSAHLQRRRLLQPALRPAEIPGYGPIMQRRAHELCDALRPGEPVEIHRLLYQLTVSTAAEALFSVDLAGPVVSEVDRSLPVVTNGVALRAFLPPAFERLPLPLNRRYDLAIRRLRGAVETAISRQSAMAPDGRNLLAALQEARDPDSGAGLTDGQVRDEIITIMLAGTDTPAAILAWTLYALARDPDLERRLHAELDEVLGSRPAVASDVPDLPLTGRILTEASRLCSALLLMRSTVTPVPVGDRTLPPGSHVLLSPYLMHRDPRFFDDRFDPDRWLPERAHRIPRKAFLPFGAGPHKCIGDNFAWTEMVIVLATICSRWRFRLAPGAKVKAVAAVVPRPDGLYLVPEARVPAAT